MKKILLAIIAIGALGACAFYATNKSEPPSVPEKIVSTPAATPAPPVAPVPAAPPHPTAPIPPVAKTEEKPKDGFVKAVETIISPQTTLDEKESTLGQLGFTGQLDHTISELEKLAAANPDSPEIFAALGRAYMSKAGTIQDLTQMGVMGMKIDQALSTALKLDPANWDAQYYKAVSLSAYPPFMNKGQEVVKTYLNLIQQQEQQPAQLQFANAYVRLGEQYQKQGDNDKAQQTWQRGAALFPDNSVLRKKIIPSN